MASTILSDNGVTSGSAGLKTTAASDGALALQTTTAGGTATTALTISTAQNVGIGTTTPGQLLDISTTTGDIQARIGNSVTGTQFTYDIGRVAASGLLQFYGNQSGATGYIFSGINGERMRIDSSGNVGIGTSSPVNRLTVDGGAAQMRLRNTTVRYRSDFAVTSAGLNINSYDDTGAVYLPVTLDGSINQFSTSGTERMRIDSSGNVGIGVTSPAWGGGFKALDVGSVTSLWTINSGAGTSYYSNNIYYNGSNRIYKTTGNACEYTQGGGSHGWFVAASGTAGNSVSLTNVANLDTNSMYVYVGVNPSSNGVASARIFNSSAGASTTTLYIGNASITTVSDSRLKENVVNTQRNALELLGQLRVVDHTWNDPSDQCENNRNSRGTWMGLIAQEAQPIIPWLVNKPTADVDENGDPQYWHMDYGYSVPLLVKAIQELKAINDTQAETINALTARIVALEQA